MKNPTLTVILLLVFLVSLTSNVHATTPYPADPQALVYVNLPSSDDLSRFASTGLPMYTLLGAGLLTGADHAGQQSLYTAKLSFLVLDPSTGSSSYYLVHYPSNRPAPDYSSYGLVLLKISSGVLIRMDSSQVSALSRAGAELQLISLTPKPLPATQSEVSFPDAIEPDPNIQGMIDQVTETQVYTYDRQLAGELPVYVDGSWYTIPSRYTYSGTPIEKTTHFVSQHMQNLGLDVEYHSWGGPTYPNVIGEITGQTNPDDIYMIGAHLDDVDGTPGADDNASGAVATLLAADIFSQYQWNCTLRFAFWTGEEQGLLGSGYYAERAYNSGENILGYLNLDMIAWNAPGSDPYINLYYSSLLTPTQELAQLYSDVIDAYNIDLFTRIGTDLWGSDHNSFWDRGFTSILAIEDGMGDDWNPYYHGPGDTPDHTDPTYFTNFVKASIGTFAHMSGCLVPPEYGALNGHVTEAEGGAPLVGVTVTADDGHGLPYVVNTDQNGYYTMTLITGDYVVSAAQAGYVPQVDTATITTGQVTNLDFALLKACEPVSGLDFSWVPVELFIGDVITLTATANGTQPIDFQWDFSDTVTATGETVTHLYAEPGTYTVSLSATNACGSDEAQREITVHHITHEFYLPFLNKE